MRSAEIDWMRALVCELSVLMPICAPVRLTALLMFGAGYVLGTRAGRERYAQIVTIAEKASARLEAFSADRRPDASGLAPRGADRDPRRRQAAR